MIVSSLYLVTFLTLINYATCDQLESPDNRIHLITENIDWAFFQDLDIIHQAIRLRHGVPQIYANETLVNAARQRAIVRAWYENDPQSEEHDYDVSENVYYQSDPDEAVSATKIMANWYTSEERLYNYDNPMVTDQVKHFLPIVSESTLTYGCGQVRSTGLTGAGIYTVCLYSPAYQPGNETVNINKPLFSFKNDQFDFSMVDDLEVGLIERLKGSRKL
ncbi:uncharacterized protein LOC107364930 [Tetranychus urticae]|uniref:uncharacterized protein LOC107364930 n=1 Tax=Tetranychus urticae TaxID=32264 RepID=UPI00077BA8A4|nr:uncharacterized protein LOC107364930 [Tetranychus urticae]